MVYSTGGVLASLVPEKAPAIMARAADYAENRLVCGMHRRRDIQADQVLGTVVADLLLHNPGFETEFALQNANCGPPASPASRPVPLSSPGFECIVPGRRWKRRLGA
jgi:hypothetical protein